MSIILQNSLNREINKRFGLSLKIENHEEINKDAILNCLTYTTQDYDSFIEFMYTFNLKLDLVMPPAYFEPNTHWSYIRLPKIKLKWRENIKVPQVKVGLRDYNLINGTWMDDGKIILPVLENASCIIKPLYTVPVEQRNKNILIPYGEFNRTKIDREPSIKVDGHTLSCKYPLTHYCVSINRQGIYINRKYRDKTEYIALPEQYIIVEPKEVILVDIMGNKLIIA